MKIWYLSFLIFNLVNDKFKYRYWVFFILEVKDSVIERIGKDKFEMIKVISFEVICYLGDYLLSVGGLY